MDAPTAEVPVRINRWLPYWAVFQSDIRATLRSWVYRTWIILSLLSAGGYFLYRLGGEQIAGMLKPTSSMVSDLLQWTVIGSVTLIIALTVGSITSERGTMADSILSRGISRYQYFLGKWHARLLTILISFLVMAALWVLASYFLLDADVKPRGILWGVLTLSALLIAIVTCGVAISAIANSTVLGMALIWITLYGISYLMTLIPTTVPSPDKFIERLPIILQGRYTDGEGLVRLMGWSMLLSFIMALVGMGYFARRDV